VLLQFPGEAVGAWRDALVATLPEADVSVWPQAGERPDYALVWKPPAELFLRSAPTKAIFNVGAGVEALLACPTLPPDVPVYRLEDAGMAEQMAEYVTLAVLRAYREADGYAAQQREARWEQRARLPKADFGVGILGFGLLGRSVAAALAPFGFPLAGWSRERKVEPAVQSYAGDAELAAFLARTRVLVCLLPSTPATRNRLDRATLSRLPRGAHVVNVARGDIVVEADLLALLDEGHLASATLDVFREEPLPPGQPFWHHPRIVVTPHVSAATLVPDSVAQIVAKIRMLERDEAAGGKVERTRGY
jgi:glyoxylate/hydroxypyruvate reductase A